MNARDADLLTPSLAEGFDVRQFRAPWRPRALIIAAFFGGAIGGGLLFALNYWRMQRPAAARNTLLAAMAIALLSVVAMGSLISADILDISNAVHKSAFRYGTQLVYVVVAVFVARDQERRFRAYEMADLPIAKVLWPAVGAIVLGMVVHGILAMAAIALVGLPMPR